MTITNIPVWSIINALSLRGAWHAARCCAPELLHHSPASACHLLSAAAAPWDSALTLSGPLTALLTARRALHVGVAVRSAADQGPSPHPGHAGSAHPGLHSHAGRRGRGWQGPRGREGAQGRGGWQDWGGAGSGGGQAGVYTPAPSGLRRGREPVLSHPSHLGQLQEYVRQRAEQWADDRNYEEFFRAFNQAGKVNLNVAFLIVKLLCRRAPLGQVGPVLVEGPWGFNGGGAKAASGGRY